MIDKRREAIGQAIANNALSGFSPSAYAHSVYEQWIHGNLTIDVAVRLVMQHHRDNPRPDSDNAARENTMNLTDSRQLHMAEADITTLRLAELEVDPV
ncbi:MAG: hypothetical protein B7X81_01195 [Hydrogenophilales bacterium 17-61-76]|nr:MAG: hypothetical protein B7Y21_02940 [Hydrogenophilales bacterium 16-61-112]OZA50426.1 MAG: hypothetical protein B7X81_01195 [Hydrogenophilales bacterium 17-61-76]HQT29604.1 antitoxin VbhA family protein [Thiobacillus sp.]